MDLAQKTKKIQDEENEAKFGYVFGVSGPGEFEIMTFSHQDISVLKFLRFWSA